MDNYFYKDIWDKIDKGICFIAIQKDQDKEFEQSALEDIEVAFATTIHKSQGSEYHTVIVVVPPVGSPLLRRELLYTAVTRARKHLVLIASEDAITSAVMSTINRASG